MSECDCGGAGVSDLGKYHTDARITYEGGGAGAIDNSTTTHNHYHHHPVFSPYVAMGAVVLGFLLGAWLA